MTLTLTEQILMDELLSKLMQFRNQMELDYSNSVQGFAFTFSEDFDDVNKVEPYSYKVQNGELIVQSDLSDSKTFLELEESGFISSNDFTTIVKEVAEIVVKRLAKRWDALSAF